MKTLMLGACLAAIAGAPALAQPNGYDQGGGYQDQRDPYYDQDQTQPQTDRGYQYDRGYNNDPGYQDDRGYQNDPGYQDDRGYGDDSGYGGRRYDNDDRYGGDDDANGYGRQAQRDWRGGYAGMPAGAHFTGRVGASWSNAQGQTCSWRELAWLDANGQPAYRWVPRCRQ